MIGTTLSDRAAVSNEGIKVDGMEAAPLPAGPSAGPMVPDAKKYILEAIDNPEATYDPEIWDSPGFTLVLFWLTQKWQERCNRLAHGRSANPDQCLTNERQKACLDSAAAELIREITQQPSLN